MEFMVFVINATEYGKTGSEDGVWLRLPMTADKLVKTLAEIGVTPTDNYIIMDADVPFDYEIDEYARLDYLNDLAGMLEERECDFEWMASYKEATGESLEATIERYEEHSVFYHDMDMEDVARNLVAETVDLPTWLDDYVDYEKLADNLEYDDYYETEYGVIQLY